MRHMCPVPCGDAAEGGVGGRGRGRRRCLLHGHQSEVPSLAGPTEAVAVEAIAEVEHIELRVLQRTSVK